jgi:hypothetical protein
MKVGEDALLDIQRRLLLQLLALQECVGGHWTSGIRLGTTPQLSDALVQRAS